MVSHIFISLVDAQAISVQSTYDATDINRTGNNSTQACQIDVNCANPLPAASDAVVWLVYNRSGGYANFCSGTLMNDNLNSKTPYVLTANHCISSQTVASNLYTEFKDRSLTCNVATTGEYFPTATTGAALLYTAYATDSTLLRLYGTPSAPNVLFAGWDSTVAPAVSTAIHSVHHPQGDQQRLTRGTISTYYTRTASGGLNTATVSTGTIIGVTQTSGNTEPGSSGSGLLKGAETSPVVIGQLFGRLVGNTPTDSCLDSVEKRIYGRFDIAYNNGMIDYLTQGIKPIYRFFNTQKGTHFYTRYVSERNAVSGSLPQFSYEGPAFSAYSVMGAGLSPVYRFFNTSTGAHFYTINAGERDTVINTLPQYSYEGIGWYAQTTAGNNAIPLYRFFHKVNGTHFYTISSVERDSIINNLAVYSYEGIAYYVWP